MDGIAAPVKRVFATITIMSCRKTIGFLTLVILSVIIMLGLNRHMFIAPAIFKNTDSGSQNSALSLQSPNLTFADLSMAERVAFVTDRCRDIKQWPEHRGKPAANAYVFIDTTQKLMACNNHKVGSSTITEVFRSIRNRNNIKTWDKFRRGVLYHDLPPKTINRFEYLSFMFVREPLRRLFSAYHHFNMQKITFETFLKNELSTSDENRTHLLHLSYYKTCRPCDVHYDYYGTTDTFDDDIRYILKRQNISFDTVPHKNQRTKTSENWEQIFINLPLKVKNDMWERFKEDYYLFGYPHPADKYRRT